jgi:hypothetical protein
VALLPFRAIPSFSSGFVKSFIEVLLSDSMSKCPPSNPLLTTVPRQPQIYEAHNISEPSGIIVQWRLFQRRPCFMALQIRRCPPSA